MKLTSLAQIALGLLPAITGIARAEDSEKTPLNQLIGTDELQFSGFIDSDFSYDFNQFKPRNRTYLTQPTRDREGQLNLAMVDGKLTTDQFRGRIAVQAGTSVDVNYAAEPEYGWRYIQEASLGTKLADGLWIDAGIYLSHIGLESWNSRDDWSYTRLLSSEFTPYYESGAKLSYDVSPELSLQLHYLNGWQNISDISGRNAVGTQVSYKLPLDYSLTWNTFLGNEPLGTRFFNELIGKTPLLGPIELAAFVDFGNQNREEGRAEWYSYALLGRYNISDSVKVTARAEQYRDPDGVIVATPNGESFKVWNLSAGLDLQILKGLWWRNEYRAMIAQDPVFPAHEDEFKKTDHFVVSSLSYSF